MKEKFAGQALALGNNIDTDQIYPGRYLALTNPEEIGSHCLEGVDEGIARKFPKGGIIVAGIGGKVESGQNLEINMTAGVLKNLDTGEQHQCETIGEYAMSILEAGGIKPLFIKRIKEEGHDS